MSSLSLFIDAHPSQDDVLEEVLRGLASCPKTLPAKLFYDVEGSRLFDQICALPEYYPTRTEIGIMEAEIDAIAKAIGPDASILEYGSGSSTKTEILLDGLENPVAYLPIDISRDHLLTSASRIAERHPRLKVLPVCADYTRDVPGLKEYARNHHVVVYFPGSTIGNFDPRQARLFLGSIAGLVGDGGGLLIGVDLKKDPRLLRAAYNDSLGVTSEFNLNMLRHINHRVGSLFDPTAFEHDAIWNESAGRIEMHLRASSRQVILVNGSSFVVEEGESIVTEHSYKYSVDGFCRLAESTGLTSSRVWVDEERLFSVHYLTVEG